MSTIHQAAHSDFSVENYTLMDVLDLKEGGYVNYLRRGGQPVVKCGSCSHCGIRIRYAAVLAHVNGERIMVGQDCLGNRFSGSNVEFAYIRKSAAEKSAASKRDGKINIWLAAHPDFAGLVAGFSSLRGIYGEFVSDVILKLQKNGELSEAQVAGVRKVVARRNEWATKRAEEAASMSPAPTGRITFTGTVLSTKIVDGMYGPSHKMLILAEGNYKVWLSIPSVLMDDLGNVSELKAQTMTLTATLTPSSYDATFAIGKRPTLAAAK